MDIKWIEDFLDLARTRNFSRSAADRNVTQSAFSRRIQALENWLGVPLFDRSTYPTSLTREGHLFRETGEEVIRLLLASRSRLRASDGPSCPTISVAALHTLALTFFPTWLQKIKAETTPLVSRLLPDDFHNCMQAVVEGGYDFLLTFHHPSVPFLLEPEVYPHILVGHDSLVAVRASPARHKEDVEETLLDYAPKSFLGRVSAFAERQRTVLPARTTHVNENAMAEALKFMVLAGHGRSWLPRSLVSAEIQDSRLSVIGTPIPLEIRLYRDARRTRPVVEAVWAVAQSTAHAACE